MSDEEKIFTIISTTGTAKSCYLKAVQESRDFNQEQAAALIKQGDEALIAGHKIHAGMVQQEAAGKAQAVSLLLVHAEDQFMSAEVIKALVNELIAVYDQLNDLRKRIVTLEQ